MRATKQRWFPLFLHCIARRQYNKNNFPEAETRRQGISELMKRELEPGLSVSRFRKTAEGSTFRTETRGTRLRKQKGGEGRERTDRSSEKENGSAERRKKGETRSIYLLNVFRAFVGVCRIPTGNTSRLKERCRVWLANPTLRGRESPRLTGYRWISRGYLPLNGITAGEFQKKTGVSREIRRILASLSLSEMKKQGSSVFVQTRDCRRKGKFST